MVLISFDQVWETKENESQRALRIDAWSKALNNLLSDISNNTIYARPLEHIMNNKLDGILFEIVCDDKKEIEKNCEIIQANLNDNYKGCVIEKSPIRVMNLNSRIPTTKEYYCVIVPKALGNPGDKSLIDKLLYIFLIILIILILDYVLFENILFSILLKILYTPRTIIDFILYNSDKLTLESV